MSENLSIYRELQNHLDTLPIGYPATESGVEIRLLKQLFTPEEAKIATMLEFSFVSIEAIYERIDNTEMSVNDLEQILDNSVSKGATIVKKEGSKKYYANNMFMIGIYDMQSHRNSENLLKFWEDSSQYFKEGMDEEFLRSGICQFRVVPIEKSISIDQEVTAYDNVRQVIENVEGPIVVNDCVCRHKKDVHGEPCKQTNLRETCFVLSDVFSQIYIDQGWGRQVSKEEALEIISKTENDGLVYEIGNSQTPGSLCCCCGCCCGYLSDMNELPKPSEFLKSNFYTEVERENCTGCGTCIDRCQMNALTLIDDISTVNHDSCIGCGACVPTCPSDAIHLTQKDVPVIPPKDWDALYGEIMNRK
ncbi:MAG: ATP-binding protein [Promethearchaeota archaeon]|jgi:NAD-dependent dihydropyrimidine dehydrogenase PreA subunit/tetrahydromethanopterin S-methyltransferase subunit B